MSIMYTSASARQHSQTHKHVVSGDSIQSAAENESSNMQTVAR